MLTISSGATATLTVGQRVRHHHRPHLGTVMEIPEGRSYVFIQWDDIRPGNWSGENPATLTPEGE